MAVRTGRGPELAREPRGRGVDVPLHDQVELARDTPQQEARNGAADRGARASTGPNARSSRAPQGRARRRRGPGAVCNDAIVPLPCIMFPASAATAAALVRARGALLVVAIGVVAAVVRTNQTGERLEPGVRFTQEAPPTGRPATPGQDPMDDGFVWSNYHYETRTASCR